MQASPPQGPIANRKQAMPRESSPLHEGIRAARALLHASLIAGSLIFASAARAQLSFSFDYSTNTPGVGFDDPTTGAARKAALETAATGFSAMFGTYFNNTANIVLRATSSDTPVGPMGGALASAGSRYADISGFGAGEVVRNKVISNGAIDLSGSAYDGRLDINWGASWELDYNTPAVEGITFDLYSALYHEFTHALGFATTISMNGTDLFGDGTSLADGGSGVFGHWSKYDQFLTNGAGVPLIDPATGLNNLALYNPGSISLMAFESPQAGSLKLYTPDPYAPGSSISHLDGIGDNTLAMMKYDRNTGPQEARDYNADEINILTSLGYLPIPEPASSTLVLAAFGLAVLSRRRKA